MNTADAKAKAAQYFTILNRIEYVIALDKNYSEPAFLAFYRKFNTIYNTMHRVDTTRDPIEVYYDNRIGIVEVETGEPKAREAKETKMAEGREPFRTERQMSILEIVAARNQHEAHVGVLIDEFKAKLDEFFAYMRAAPEGQRLIVKMQSRLPEDEIYADFAKLYRRYKAFYRAKVGDYFFAVTEELVEKLCDEFEGEVVASRVADIQRNQQAQPNLLAQAQRRLPPAKQHRLERLAAKSEAETITAAERAELLKLSAVAEQLDAERAEALVMLAQQRGVTLAQLWDELNPDQR